MSLKIIPSIDLLDGACVRLSQGRFDSVTNYGRDPLALAQSYEAKGAGYLHLVDLDGAKNGRPMQVSIVQTLVEETSLRVQIGGGIRSLQQVHAYLTAGADRVVIGSLAVTNPELTRAIISDVGENRITLAFDLVKDAEGQFWPAFNAWTAIERKSLEEIFAAYDSWQRIEYLCTDISRDGALSGIDESFYENLLRYSPASSLLVSGGVATIEDVKIASRRNLGGVIIGKALYEARIDLKEALEC